MDEHIIQHITPRYFDFLKKSLSNSLNISEHPPYLELAGI